MATFRARPLPHVVLCTGNPATPHIYRTNGRWLVGFGPLTPIHQVNMAIAWVARTQRAMSYPVRW